MADSKELFQWVLARLRPIGGEIYDGMVPESVPLLAAGQVQPYLALWMQPLREHPEQPLDYSHQETASGLTVTVAGHSPGTVRSRSQDVLRRLHRVPAPGGGEYRHTIPYAPIMYDSQATPGRYFQPVEFEFLQP